MQLAPEQVQQVHEMGSALLTTVKQVVKHFLADERDHFERQQAAAATDLAQELRRQTADQTEDQPAPSPATTAATGSADDPDEELKGALATHMGLLHGCVSCAGRCACCHAGTPLKPWLRLHGGLRAQMHLLAARTACTAAQVAAACSSIHIGAAGFSYAASVRCE
jgi:hypothetical protein